MTHERILLNDNGAELCITGQPEIDAPVLLRSATRTTAVTFEVRNEDTASLMLAIARAAGWQTHSEQMSTRSRCTPGAVEDWQADAVTALLGAIRKAADDKVAAEAEAEELEHAAHLFAAYIPRYTLAEAREELRDDNTRSRWLHVVTAARAQFAPNSLPF